MSFNFENLDAATRREMLAELAEDVAAKRLNPGRRATPAGAAAWEQLLRAAAERGNAESLANALRAPGLLEEFENRTSRTTGKVTTVRVPATAADSLAEGEFNRLYIRALCRRALAAGQSTVEVYRARASSNPRPESEALIGTRLDARRVLNDLREHVGVDAALGVPGGVNSGLSVRLVR